MALLAVWARVPDLVGGTGDLFLNHTQFPDPQLFEVPALRKEAVAFQLGLRAIVQLDWSFQLSVVVAA